MWGISRNHHSVQVPVRALLVEVQETKVVVVLLQGPSAKGVDVAMQQQRQEN
jgi:hypothetical protein